MTSPNQALVSAALWALCAYVFHDQPGWPQVVYVFSIVGVGFNLGVAATNYNNHQRASANTNPGGVR